MGEHTENIFSRIVNRIRKPEPKALPTVSVPELPENPEDALQTIARPPSIFKENGELLRGWVKVYRVIPKEKITDILEKGLELNSEEPDRYTNVNIRKTEDIFEEAAKEKGIKDVDRRKCIFAYTIDPRTNFEIPLDPDKDAIVEIAINYFKSKAMVSNYASFTDANEQVMNGNDSLAKKYAQGYWADAVPLATYDLRKNSPNFMDFPVPEILIPEPIPPEHIRLSN